MAIDAPARIAIVGAGPIGIEAALYARFLGYEVELIERGRVCENLLRWGHVRLFTPWRDNVSPLGLAALAAQDPAWRPAPAESRVTGRAMVSGYFLPLAQTDLLADGLREGVEVVAIGRESFLKRDFPDGDPDADEKFTRADDRFRLLTRDASGVDTTSTADVVIDASGVYGRHNALGVGGIQARGEKQAACKIAYDLVDFSGVERERYAGKHTLVVGAGLAAAHSILGLARLASESPETRITWFTRGAETKSGPIPRPPRASLAPRDELAAAANRLAAGPGPVEHRSGVFVDAIVPEGEGLRVSFVGDSVGENGVGEIGAGEIILDEITVDEIIAAVGHRPDDRFAAELHTHRCPKTDASWISRGDDSAESSPVASFVQPEPNYYVLGASSFGRRNDFLLSHGRDQIRRLFALIGDRANLDLYANAAPLADS